MSFWEGIGAFIAAAFGFAFVAVWFSWVTILPTIGVLYLAGVLR